MNNLHPLFQHILQTHGVLPVNHSAPIRTHESLAYINSLEDDHATIEAMKISLRSSLNAALSTCARLAGELNHVDGNELMALVRVQFDPDKGAITDLFSDSFADTTARLNQLESLGR